MSTPKLLMVIAPKDFRDEELLVPRKAFQSQGWTVDTVSTETGEATGMLGAREEISNTLSDVSMSDYHAIIVVGGMGSIEYLWPNETLHRHVQQAYQDSKTVGAICLSGAVLGLAGVLNNKKATVWETPESRAAIEDNGGTFTGEPVTVDGNIITANGPEAAEEFTQALIEAVSQQVGTATA